MKLHVFKGFPILFVLLFTSLNFINGEDSNAGASEVDNSVAKQPQEFNEVLNWESPYDLKKNLPYFLSGFDDDGCPIWIAELGKWDVRAQIATFGFEQVQNYTHQMLVTIYTSGERERKKQRDWAGISQTESGEKTGECENGEYNWIVDMDGFSNRQLAHPPTLTSFVNLARVVLTLETKGQRMKRAVGINFNYVANALYSVGSPFLGSVVNRLTIFGTNPEGWKPKLLKLFPKSELPDWMGGSQDFKPIRVYG